MLPKKLQHEAMPLTHTFGRSSSFTGKRCGSNRKQSGKCCLPVRNMCRTYHALYANSQYPDQAVDTLAIAARSETGYLDSPIPPCGACRQVLLETEQRFHQPCGYCFTVKTTFMYWKEPKTCFRFHSEVNT